MKRPRRAGSEAEPLALGGRRMKRKLFAESWQRTRVFRICRGGSERPMPPKRRHAIVDYRITCVRYNPGKRLSSNIRKTRVLRRESRKTFFPQASKDETALPAGRQDRAPELNRTP